MQQKADFHNRYDILARLGKGQFATVYELLEKSTNIHWAGKVVNKAACPASALESELSILKSLSHPQTPRLKEVFNTEEVCIIVQELVTGGELFDRISEQGVFSEKYAAKFFRDLLLVVKHLHEKKIVHRDLKPENIMLSDRTENAVLKLIDFGASKFAINDKSIHGVRGTPPYMAPEIFAYAPYGRPVDIWALGIILYVILAGIFPYDPNEKKFDCHFFSPEFDNVSESAKDILLRLLDKNPDTRITVEQALEHPWVTGEKASASAMSVSNLRQMVARKRFKRAVEAVRATNRFSRILKLKNSPRLETKDHAEDGAQSQKKNAIIDSTRLDAAVGHLEAAEKSIQNAIDGLKHDDGKHVVCIQQLTDIIHSLTSQRLHLKPNTGSIGN